MIVNAKPFLETIRAAMARDDKDQSAWLVYADWLEETSREAADHDLAELIRASCEYEAIGKSIPTIPCTQVTSRFETKYHGIDRGPGYHIGEVSRNDAAGIDPSILVAGTLVRLQAFDGTERIGRMFANLTPETLVRDGDVVIIDAPDPDAKRKAARRQELMIRKIALQTAIASDLKLASESMMFFKFHRGLLDHVDCTVKAWTAVADGVMVRHPVTRVVLQRWIGDKTNAKLKAKWPEVTFKIPKRLWGAVYEGRNATVTWTPTPREPVPAHDA